MNLYHKKKLGYPFIVFDKIEKKHIGSTLFCAVNIDKKILNLLKEGSKISFTIN